MRYTVIIENNYGELEASHECATLKVAKECLLGEYNRDCEMLGLPLRNIPLSEDKYALRYTKGCIIDNEK